jgi:hypothetical protein
MTRTHASTYVLSIGINTYRHLRALQKATSDAHDVVEAIKAGNTGNISSTVLVDTEATKQAICTQLDRLARDVGEDDLVIIFFSGHGTQLQGGFWPGEYLCPVEMTPIHPTSTAISYAEWTIALQSIRAGRLVVLLDACHAGGIGEVKGAHSTYKNGLSVNKYERWSYGKGRYILASSTPDEPSVEFSEMRNGLFTHCLLEGLRGKAAREDASVWVTALFGYVYQEVSRQHSQHPFLKANGEDFILSVAPTVSLLNPNPPPAASSGALASSETRASGIINNAGQVTTQRLHQLISQVYQPAQVDVLAYTILGLRWHQLSGEELLSKTLSLVDQCWKLQRNGRYQALIQAVVGDYPYLADELGVALPAG